MATGLVLPELELREIAARILDDGGEADAVAGRHIRKLERVPEADACEARVSRPERPRELRGRASREVAAPAVDAAEGSRRKRQHGDRGGPNGARLAHDLLAGAEPGLLHGDQTAEILPGDERGGDGVARLLALAVDERRAVGDGEHGDADAH